MSKLYVAKSQNLSVAWAEVFFHLMEPGGHDIAPAVITISDFDERSLPRQIPEIQKAIDGMNTQSCRTVASTIFPNSLWTPDADDSADQLYARYEKLWPTIKKCPANRNGVYFRRLTAYRPKYERQEAPPVNQLKHVIDTYRSGNHRHSALQASIFNPLATTCTVPAEDFLVYSKCPLVRPGGDAGRNRFLRIATPCSEGLWKLSRSLLARSVHGAANGLAADAGHLYCFVSQTSSRRPL